MQPAASRDRDGVPHTTSWRVASIGSKRVLPQEQWERQDLEVTSVLMIYEMRGGYKKNYVD